ncbi:haloacid dehalogenase type II [Dinoroseobacter sp. S76]|uniref:haloacid dehalogenase type II n=1 Tax=Dinoroseobacter sp. S76 TaxID=3415124 RepID=UPI003C7D3414
MKPATLAFDVYGTLINPLAMAAPLAEIAGDKAGALAKLWRETQLAYSFRRAAMGAYAPFSQVTEEALDYALDAIGIQATSAEKAALLAQYTRLPAFDEVPEALAALAKIGHKMHAFSNGTLEDIGTLMDTAGLSTFLGDPVSVAGVQSFKPDPRVYALFEEKTAAEARSVWLLSSNPFDIIGAGQAGWNTIWVQRSPEIPFDPWGKRPTHIVSDLSEVAALIG